MANEQNLKPIKKGQLSKEEAKRRGSLGGKRSAQVRRERRAMQEIARIVLDMPLEKGDLDDIGEIEYSAFPDSNITVGEKAMLAVARKAMKGDASALAFLRDTAGEKPVEKVEVNADVAKAEAEVAAIIAKRKAKGDG